MMKNSTAKMSKPKTFQQLVKSVEAALKDSGGFSGPMQNSDEPVVLLTLKLDEVRALTGCKKDQVTILASALFQGAAPTRVDVTDKLQAELGISGLRMGMGAFTFDNGTAEKGVSFKVSAELLENSLASALQKELEKNPKVRAERARQKARTSKAYQAQEAVLKKCQGAVAVALQQEQAAERKLATIFAKESARA